MALPTPVDVQIDDVIGLTTLRNCAGLVGEDMITEGTAAFDGDVSGSFDLSTAFLVPAYAAAVSGFSSVDAEIRTQVIVAAASAQGIGGSSFKTEIELANPLKNTVSGRLVYHPEATSGMPTDISVPFTLTAGQSRIFPDFVGGLGLSGKGSIDVYTTVGFEAPAAAARVFEDSSGGTKGFTMDALTLDHAMQSNEQGILFEPRDPTKFRMNIGIRTLDGLVQVQFLVQNGATGALRVPAVTKDYPANYYVQTDAASLIGTPLQSGDTILVYPNGASPIFVYGSIIDNSTNDPSLQFASAVK